MATPQIVSLLNEGLRDIGSKVSVVGLSGGWVRQSHIQFKSNGKSHHLPFWEGGDDVKIAKSLFEDMQDILTRS